MTIDGCRLAPDLPVEYMLMLFNLAAFLFNSLVNCVSPQMFNRDSTVIWEHDDDGFQILRSFSTLDSLCTVSDLI